MNKVDVLVLGAGTGGVVAANTLANRYKVLVIERSSFHLFQPGLLFIAFKGHESNRYMMPVRDLLKPEVDLLLDSVSLIDLDNRVVETASKKVYEYRYLIIALGASLDYDLIPGHREIYDLYGDFFSNVEAAKKLWSKIVEMKKGDLIVGVADPLYKCPPTPHKAVLLVADELIRMRGRGKTLK